jgi:N-methylhydantoinase A
VAGAVAESAPHILRSLVRGARRWVRVIPSCGTAGGSRALRYEREALAPGTRLSGPALVVEYSSTTLVPPGWQGIVDADRHLHLEVTR